MATLCWLIWYHPPQFEHLHRDRTRWQEVRDMDYGGILLFTGGLILFLTGLSWGGELYPWQSAHVIATLVVGAVVLILFVLYGKHEEADVPRFDPNFDVECFMPLRRPLIPMHLFRNYDYDMVNILSIVGGMVYYSMNGMAPYVSRRGHKEANRETVLFPQMVAFLYTTDIVEGGLVSCCVGGGVVAGQFFGSWLAVPGGHLKYKLMFVTAGLCAFVAGLAGATNSQALGSTLAVLSGLMVGLLEVSVSTMVTIVIEDQSEMGTGAGVFGSLRGAGGVLASKFDPTNFILKVEYLHHDL